MKTLLLFVATMILVAIIAHFAWAYEPEDIERELERRAFDRGSVQVDWDCVSDCTDRAGWDYCKQFCSYREE